MSDDANVGRTISMKGGGYYSQATTGAKIVIDRATDMILNAVAEMDIPDDGSVFSFADMGAADAGTSLEMVGNVLQAVRARAPSRPLTVCYTDLPRNDFSQVFQNVQGLTGLPTYWGSLDNLYVFASATSFHDKIFPPGSLHLGFSATASHYISDKPCTISNHVHMVGAQGAELAAYAEQGRRDWRRILLNRTQELVPGGCLVMFNFGRDEEGRYLGHTAGVNIFDTFNEIWRGYVEKGIITAAEYEGTNFPQYYRTVDEFTAPLTDSDDPVYQAGLRLAHVETRVVGCPYAADFLVHGDAQKFAADYVPTLRSWSEVVFASSLSGERSAEERAEIIDRFYGDYQELVAADPSGHAMDYVHCYLVMRKE